MTMRERFLRAMRLERVEGLVWAPNLDYWYRVNNAEGTMPAPYRDMSRDDVVRAIGGAIWSRAGGCRTTGDPSVRVRDFTEGQRHVRETATPLGTVVEVRTQAEGPHRTKALVEHAVKSVDDLAVMRFLWEARAFEPDHEPARRALTGTGDDGVVVACAPCVPFIQFAKTDCGYLNAYYLWADHREEVDGYVEVVMRKSLEMVAALASGPADIIWLGDNMDGVMISPDIFREYALPYYRAVADIVRPAGKILEVHWCGRTETLLEMLPGSGVDVAEAIVTEPMAGISLAEALDRLDGRVALQGGIPAVLVCEEGGTRAEFDRYLEHTILPLAGRPGFILGMSDNVPPNADFRRVERIAESVKRAVPALPE